jgi:phosphatidylserine/phosphatidylglycerophosphate/cardiolipin synthase-like enzyme
MKTTLLITALLFASTASANPITMDGPCNVYFSPKGGATEAVVNLINGAHQSIHVLAYSFTSTPIANALVAAKTRGVDVEIILDKTQPTAKGGEMQYVMAAGIPVWVDSVHAIAHNKVMLVDGKYIETGSFNYTSSAEKSNGENALICPSVSGYNTYLQNWKLHQSHSVKQ